MSLPAGLQGIGSVFYRTKDGSFKGTDSISGWPVGFSLDVVIVREDAPGIYTGLDRRLSKGLDVGRS